MKHKWYLGTWFICLMFALWFLVIPGIIGICLLTMQFFETRKLKKKYGNIDELERTALKWEERITNLQKQHEDVSKTLALETVQKKNEINLYEEEILSLQNQLNSLNKEINISEREIICKQYIYSDYDGLSSEECKNKLAVLKNKEQEVIKSVSGISISSTASKKVQNDNIKQILRCFNSECDNILLNLSVKNIDSSRNKITKAFDSLNKIFEVDGIQLNRELLEFKLEELNLVYTYEKKKEIEREQQRAIKEQMIEEEKVRREIERQKAKLEKDQIQCSNEINKLMGYMQKTQSDVEKQLYIDKIKELEKKLEQLEKEKATVLEREANARAGYVYVISNIGSFGENIFKIGMTRRLEPMDRIKELSSASVPFDFDVHAMIFSDDAPALETALHQKFEKQSVNRVNLRKEFFKVSLDDIETVVKEKYNNTVTFTRIPVAKEYNETLSILKQEQSA
ncbi:MAG TPA: DUF4041 domain-containing protein [Candidatus Hungatella pullicola]|nr:DUF4041 domain-containing protein [Candidatus Hungatella pullicola]